MSTPSPYPTADQCGLTQDEFNLAATHSNDAFSAVLEALFRRHGEMYAADIEKAEEGAPFISGALYAILEFAMEGEDEDDAALKVQISTMVGHMVDKIRNDRKKGAN